MLRWFTLPPMAILRERKVWRSSKPRAKPYRLTEDEQAKVKLAMHVLRLRLGAWRHLAAEMGYTARAVEKAMETRGRVSGDMAVQVARLVGVSVDELLAGACPMCGRS